MRLGRATAPSPAGTQAGAPTADAAEMEAQDTDRPEPDAAAGARGPGLGRAAGTAGDAERLAACLALADPSGPALPRVAADAAQQALELAARLQRPVDEGRAGAWLCSQLLRLGRFADLQKHAPGLLRRLEHEDLLPERHELLRVLTLAACETGAFDVALDAAQQLQRTTLALNEPGAALSAAFAQAACFDRLGDAWQSVRLLSDAVAAHGADAPDRPLMMALNALCAISLNEFHLLRGTVPRADEEAVLERGRRAGEQARALLQQLRDPTYEVAVNGNLGETLLHLGELDAGQAAVDLAFELALQRGLKAHGWRITCSLGEGQLYAGRPAQALALVERLLQEMGGEAPPQTEIRARHVAHRACRALGRFEQALAHFDLVERLERRRTTTQLRAQSQLFVTRTEAARALWQAREARQDALQHQQRAAELAERAERDPLTGLGNRRRLERLCAELLPAAARDGSPLAVALLDVDHFKQVNDQLGHGAGDRVLVALARALRDNTRGGDIVARYGGEEFVVVVPGLEPALAAEVVERLRRRLGEQDWVTIVGSDCTVTVSAGLASAPAYELPLLLQRADEALYRAKRGGRDRLCVAE